VGAGAIDGRCFGRSWGSDLTSLKQLDVKSSSPLELAYEGGLMEGRTQSSVGKYK